jgi:hypothetical protein
MSKTLPTIPPCFLKEKVGRGRVSFAIADPKTVQKIMLAAFIDENLTDADLANRHGVSVPTVRKYTNHIKWARRHASMDVVSRNTKAVVGKIARRGSKAKPSYAFVEVSEGAYCGA